MIIQQFFDNPTEAALGTTAVYATPATTNAFAPSTIVVVQAAQRLLGLSPTGRLDIATSMALQEACGSSWRSMKWVKILERLYVEQGAVGDYVETGIDFQKAGLQAGLLLAAAYFLFLRRR